MYLNRKYKVHKTESPQLIICVIGENFLKPQAIFLSLHIFMKIIEKLINFLKTYASDHDFQINLENKVRHFCF